MIDIGVSHMTSAFSSEPHILVVDLETTSLDAKRGSILQIGAVWLSGAEGEIELNCRAWDGAELQAKALECNGCSEARCLNPALMKEGEALAQFFKWIRATGGLESDVAFMLAGLNPFFDRGFLLQAWVRAGLRKADFPIRHRLFDLHSLAVEYALKTGEPVPSRGFYTDEIYALLDMPEEPKPHTALTGARMEADAIHKLLDFRYSLTAKGAALCHEG